MVACKPRRCLGCAADPPREEDTCACGFGALNGGCMICMAQLLLLIGTLASLATLVDCAFVNVEGGEDVPDILPLGDDHNGKTNRIGFYTFEEPSDSGNCYWYSDLNANINEEDDEVLDVIRTYFDILGSDWQVGRIFASIGAGGGVVSFFYSITLCFTAQVQFFRFFFGFCTMLIIAGFQAMTFVIYSSEYCDDNVCELDRTAAYSAGAAVSYFLAGLCLVCTTDYPGEDALRELEQYRELMANQGNRGGVTTKPPVSSPQVADRGLPDLEDDDGDVDGGDTPPNNVGGDVEAPRDVPPTMGTTKTTNVPFHDSTTINNNSNSNGDDETEVARGGTGNVPVVETVLTDDDNSDLLVDMEPSGTTDNDVVDEEEEEVDEHPGEEFEDEETIEEYDDDDDDEEEVVEDDEVEEEEVPADELEGDDSPGIAPSGSEDPPIDEPTEPITVEEEEAILAAAGATAAITGAGPPGSTPADEDTSPEEEGNNTVMNEDGMTDAGDTSAAVLSENNNVEIPRSPSGDAVEEEEEEAEAVVEAAPVEATDDPEAEPTGLETTPSGVAYC